MQTSVAFKKVWFFFEILKNDINSKFPNIDDPKLMGAKPPLRLRPPLPNNNISTTVLREKFNFILDVVIYFIFLLLFVDRVYLTRYDIYSFHKSSALSCQN